MYFYRILKPKFYQNHLPP